MTNQIGLMWLKKRFVFNYLPSLKIIDWSKIRAIADNKLKLIKMMNFVVDRVEIIVKKFKAFSFRVV